LASSGRERNGGFRFNCLQSRHSVHDRADKHNHCASFVPFFISFATSEDIQSSNAEYVITAREPIYPMRGAVRFDAERDDWA
jgi:hypothetical protein